MGSVVLLSAPIFTEFCHLTEFEGRWRRMRMPPSGPLIVAALFSAEGQGVRFVDTDARYVEHLRGDSAGSFPRTLAGELAGMSSRLFGFSTICSSYHVTLLVAKHLKGLRPDATVLLGGPQATGCALDTLRSCAWVDHVLRGEVEGSVGAYVRDGADRPHLVPGLCYRDSGGSPRQTPFEEPPSLEQAPYPAWELWEGEMVRELPVEVGRGCPCRCAFCSTSSFFGRRYRVKSPARVLEGARRALAHFSCKRVMFVHDHLAARRETLVGLGEAWSADPELSRLMWTCSLRADSVDRSLVELLAAGGCSAVFLGIESGSKRMQRRMGKGLDLPRALASVDLLRRAGIACHTAFIAGFPDETDDDLTATLGLFGEHVVRPHVWPQLSLLSPLAGSRYFEEHGGELEFDGCFSDMASQGDGPGEESLALVRSDRRIFSAHHLIPLPVARRVVSVSAVRFLQYATRRFRWALAGAVRRFGSTRRLVESWIGFVHSLERKSTELSYYRSQLFLDDFISFGRNLASTDEFIGARDQFLALFEGYAVTAGEIARLRDLRDGTGIPAGSTLSGESVLIARSLIRPAAYSFAALSKAIADDVPLEGVRSGRAFTMLEMGDDQWNVVEPSALARAILRRFSPASSIQEAVSFLATNEPALAPEGMSPVACFVAAVEELCNRGLLGLPKASG